MFPVHAGVILLSRLLALVTEHNSRYKLRKSCYGGISGYHQNHFSVPYAINNRRLLDLLNYYTTPIDVCYFSLSVSDEAKLNVFLFHIKFGV